jgi:hypothetical protein
MSQDARELLVDDGIVVYQSTAVVVFGVLSEFWRK